jgi:uncharacterized protein (DUF4415 family)
MKRPTKEVIKKIKEKREADKKGNVTFRLPANLMDNFRKACEKNEVSMTEALEELIQGFILGS